MEGRLKAAAVFSVIALMAAVSPSALAAGKPFVAKGGSVTIAFDSEFVAALKAAGVEYTTGRSTPTPATASFPKLTVEAAAEEPERAPRTPLNTAKPAGYVYIGDAEIAFYSSKGEAAAEFPEIKLGARPALEAQLEENAMFHSDGKLHPLFTLYTHGVRPSVKGASLTLKNIPMKLSGEGAELLQVLGAGVSAGEAVGKLTIKVHR
jgi:hypothetical protein